MKHAILLLWHTNVKQLMELIDRFDDDFTFYIHVDKKSNEVIEELKRKNTKHLQPVLRVRLDGTPDDAAVREIIRIFNQKNNSEKSS